MVSIHHIRFRQDWLIMMMKMFCYYMSNPPPGQVEDLALTLYLTQLCLSLTCPIPVEFNLSNTPYLPQPPPLPHPYLDEDLGAAEDAGFLMMQSVQAQSQHQIIQNQTVKSGKLYRHTERVQHRAGRIFLKTKFFFLGMFWRQQQCRRSTVLTFHC